MDRWCIVSFFELRCLYIRRFTEQQMLLLGKGLSTLEPYGRNRKDHRYRVSAHEDPGISSLTSGFVIISVINVSAEFICSLLLISQLVTRYCLPVSRGICRETRLTQSGHKTLRQHHLPDFLFPNTLVVALQVSRESRQRHSQKQVMPISLEFTDKSMLVIGDERGIGFAISKDLAEAGADVVISYTSKDATFVAEEL